MIPISVCIISKNEEQYIEKCLQSLGRYDWEIIVTDTGSTDNTISLALKYTNHIYHFPWNNNFSDARNFGISHASHKWILNIDCDEYLENQDSSEELLRKLTPVLNTPQLLGMIHITNPIAGTKHLSSVEPVARLFQRDYYQYSGKIHEQPVPIHEKKEIYYTDTPLSFYHAGYADKITLSQKSNRNIQLLKDALSESPDDPYLWQQLGQSYYVINDYANALQAFDRGLSFDVNPRLQYVQNMVEAYGYCLLELKQFQQALQLENIYDTFCSRADFVFLMGLIYMNNGLFDKAIAEFEKATTIPNHSVQGVNSYLAYYNAGVICECSGQKEKAYAYYRQCGNYEPAKERLKSTTI